MIDDNIRMIIMLTIMIFLLMLVIHGPRYFDDE